MVTGPDREGFHTVDLMGSVSDVKDAAWEPFDETVVETGEVSVEALTPEEALEEHHELTHILRDAIRESNLPMIQEVSLAISMLEHQFPALEPDRRLVTARDN